ncbi:energy transducer TonB [Marinicella gelatinilytica]|uniref:hypothetical protein n=1 Tax=Marinicella gelatinilytica TaxID=2996017 RepID=UPI002260D1C3|nr:hypothetical protein [Marinicella gelatinilytica]MCX7545041.1 hypothetical protein [Marinicella gelatinilytica]
MKYLIILTALMVTTISHAQTETDTKRPSWSQGLPERQSTVQPGNPSLKTDDNRSEPIITPDISEDRPMAPVMDMNIATQPDFDFKIEPEAPQTPNTEPVRRAGTSHFQKREMVSKEINPLHAQYPWAIVKTTPLDIPSRYATKDTLKVRIYINPEGEVVRVAAGAPDVPALMLKQAQQSIQNWRFEPPKNLGITDTLSKTFTIEIKAS